MRDTHPPTRAEALSRLSAFLPNAGRDYAARRNYDLPGHPHVSALSPYLRHRLITEEEVLKAVLARFSLSTAEKFLQEVFWRTYWKGWLEQRPEVWESYRAGVTRSLDRLATEGGLRANWEAACKGETGIAAFDHWAQELTGTGYLHNHARMWFASIWVFTLELPWELGADFFLRHLLDGDPASNTLSWRWVAGLHTRGKHYIARGSNIAKYTEGRFNPGYQLNTQAPPLDGPPAPDRRPLPVSGAIPTSGRLGLIVTEDDLSPAFALPRAADATLLVNATAKRSPLAVAEHVMTFAEGAFADCAARHADRFGEVTGPILPNEISSAFADWRSRHSLDAIVMAHTPTGPAADAVAPLLAGGDVVSVLRPYDVAAWPHATAGFFKLKKQIPTLVQQLRLAPAA